MFVILIKDFVEPNVNFLSFLLLDIIFNRFDYLIFSSNIILPLSFTNLLTKISFEFK